MTYRCYVPVALACLFLAGCGKPAKPQPAPGAKAAPAVPAPAEAPAPVAAKGAEAPAAAKEDVAPAMEDPKTDTGAKVSPTSFEGRLAAVLAKEADTEFTEALALVESMLVEFKEHARVSELVVVRSRLVDAKRKSGKMAYAIARLASESFQEHDVAREVLTEDDVGLVYLRHALRTKEAKVAEAAALVLVEENDVDSFPLFLAQLRAKPSSGIARLACRLFALQAKELKRPVLDACVAIMRRDTALAAPHVVEVFEAVLRRVCGGDEQAFNKLVGQTDAVNEVRTYLEKVLISGKPELVEWACARIPELLPLIDGFRCSYCPDTAFTKVAVERSEPALAWDLQQRESPLPDGQKNDISVRWVSDVLVQRPGDHLIRIRSGWWAPREVYVWIDGEKLFDLADGAGERYATRTLTNGWHTLRVDYIKRSNPDNNQGAISLEWTPPQVAGATGDAVLFRHRPWPALISSALAGATAQLGAEDVAARTAARNLLLSSLGVGRMFLRQAVRSAAPENAAVAGAMLADLHDERAPVALIVRLKTEKDSRASLALTDALCRMTDLLDDTRMAQVYRAGFAKDAELMNPYALAAYADLMQCRGDAAVFGKRVNDPGAGERLEAAARKAIASSPSEASRRAFMHAAPFAPMLNGLLAQYFTGSNFNSMVVERAESTINLPNRQHPYPDGRQDNISARWTGYVNVVNPGSYTFIVNAHAEAKVWVDNRYVGYSSGWGEHKKDPVTLERGWHRLRVDTWQSSGNNQIQLQWVGPAGNREGIPAGLLRAPPSLTMLAQVAKDVTAYVGAKPDEKGLLVDKVRAGGGVSAFFLRQVLKQVKDVAPVVGLLADGGDASVPEIMREVRATDAMRAKAIVAAVDALAMIPDPRHGAWFYAIMKNDKDLEFASCGKALSRLWQQVGKDRFNNEFAGGDPQGVANMEAYLKRTSK